MRTERSWFHQLQFLKFQSDKSPPDTHLHNSRVPGQSVVWFGWFGHSDILDVAPSENYVFINFILGWHRPISVSVLRPIGFNCCNDNSMARCSLFLSNLNSQFNAEKNNVKEEVRERQEPHPAKHQPTFG